MLRSVSLERSLPCRRPCSAAWGAVRCPVLPSHARYRTGDLLPIRRRSQGLAPQPAPGPARGRERDPGSSSTDSPDAEQYGPRRVPSLSTPSNHTVLAPVELVLRHYASGTIRRELSSLVAALVGAVPG